MSSWGSSLAVGLGLAVVLGFVLGFWAGDLRSGYESRRVPYGPGVIVASPASWSSFGRLWNESVASGVEVGGCLWVDNLTVRSVYPAVVFSANRSQVNFSCRVGNARVHTHPSGVCRLSAQDVYSAGLTRSAFDFVICGEGRVVAYSSLDGFRRAYRVVGGVA